LFQQCTYLAQGSSSRPARGPVDPRKASSESWARKLIIHFGQGRQPAHLRNARAKTRRPVSTYTIELSRTAGARDQLEYIQASAINTPAAAVEIGGRSSRIGKADQALGNPRRDAGMTRYAKRHNRQQRSEHPVEQNQRKQAAST
jgi:hypothetical protein